MLFMCNSSYSVHVIFWKDATELFYEALPFICDAVVGDGGVQSSQTCCNVTRLQHLLDRLEQVNCMFIKIEDLMISILRFYCIIAILYW